MEDEGVTPPIQTIPMGICGQDIFQPWKKTMPCARTYGLDPDKFIFSYIGKLVSWKGVQYLLYAAKVLKRQGRTNFQIAITDAAPAGAQLKKKIIADLWGCKKKWCLPAFCRTPSGTSAQPGRTWPGITQCADADQQEQFGMVLVEAMACRKPILGSRSGAIPEVSVGASLLYSYPRRLARAGHRHGAPAGRPALYCTIG